MGISRISSRVWFDGLGGTTMAKGSGGGSSRGGGYGAGGKGSSRSGSVARGVSAARLHQKSGASNAFGGYTKVNRGDGTFRMRQTGK